MIYFNFIHAPSGGGLQNAASFLQTLVAQNYDFNLVCCFVFEGSVLERICRSNSIPYIKIKRGLVSKTLFELFIFLKIKSGDVVFSIFGPPLPFTTGKSINIGGMAISNVFYPEIDFWGFLNPIQKKFKSLKDRYRVYRYKKLDYWIFETELLADKAVKKFKFPRERVSVVKMAPSALVSKEKVFHFNPYNLEKNKIKILLLCGAHPNKRHHLLPKLARSLKASGHKDIQFIFTSSMNEYLSSVYKNINKLCVSEYFLNLGAVDPENVSSLINSVDYVMNISLLESFSNNFVEAWAMGKPLITVSDEWAVSAAKNAALYLEINDGEILLESFLNSLSVDKNYLANNGVSNLVEYPTADQKNILYLNLICKAIELGSLDRTIRKGITLK